jgi:hypothetical protein
MKAAPYPLVCATRAMNSRLVIAMLASPSVEVFVSR